jgi:hypothetical protein
MNDDYSLPKFLKSVEDLSVDEMNSTALRRMRELESVLKRGRKKSPHYDEAERLFRQLGGFRAFLAQGGKVDSLTESEFALFEPICRKLIERGFPPYKSTWLDVFKRPRPTS